MIRHSIQRSKVRWMPLAIRSHATAVHIPSQPPNPSKLNLRSLPFTSINKFEGIEYQSLPQDTYPNPLFSMSKIEIMNLSPEDYLHLIKIRSRTIHEKDQFYINLLELIDEQILEDPNLVMRLLMSVEEGEIRHVITTSLKNTFKSNKVKRSILEFIISPTSTEFRDGFMQIIKNINQLADDKGETLLNYLNKLAMSGVVNPEPLLLTTSWYTRLVRITPSTKFDELYLYLLQINIQTKSIVQMERLKKTLMRGTETQRFVARTGWIKPKWHQTLKYEFDASHRDKMLAFFAINDLREFTEYFIKKKDIVNANVYLGLLVTKFEQKSSQTMIPRYGDSTLIQDIQTILQTIVRHVMTFKGPKNCINVLKFMIKNQLEVKFDTLITIMKTLRLQGHYQEALLLMNNIGLEKLDTIQRSSLIEEILILIKSRYPRSPKILIGYITSVFNGGNALSGENVSKSQYGSTNSALSLLNDLKLLGLSHGTGKISLITSFDNIQKASVDERLTGFEFSSNSLANVYEIILDSLNKSEVTSELIYQLYETYIEQVVKSLNSDCPRKPFTNELMNDRVVNHLINALLRKTGDDFQVEEAPDRYEVAKKIMLDFNSKIKIPRKHRTVSLIDIMIHTSLMVHKDYTFASNLIRFSRENHLPFTFNQLFPFISFHYGRKEYHIAELWYNELVKHSVKSTAGPAKELFRIARELNWNVYGFAYRKNNIHKNHKAREQMESIKSDPVIFIGEEDTEDLVTEELITGGNGQFHKLADYNFCDELASILYEARSSKILI